IGGVSNKNTVRGTIGEPINDPNGLLPEYGSAGGGLLLATWFHESGKIDPRLVWATKALAMETARAFDFVGIGLIAVGLATFRRRTGSGAAVAALAGIVALHAVILCRMASLSGYLSERHTLLFVLVGSLPVAAGLLWIAQLFRRVPARYQTASLVMAGLLVASPALTKPLHYNRAGHKAAGQWLAKNAAAEDAILDPFTWGEFYAGRTDVRTRTERPDRLFVIVETGDNQHSRLPHMADARAKIALGQPVYHWPESRPLEKAQVVVYAVPGNRLPDPATTSPQPEYRVGIKAANPTVSVRSIAPGG
ncbi:MAG TPA: hypothetical protein VH120_12620, partial [Gemmataceae bacterium]|nr:hypothetical protein [Gemmataceae bacterium]